MEEIWKDIVGYEGCYQVSNQGRVKSLDRMIRTKGNALAHRNERILKPRVKECNHLEVALQKNGSVKYVGIHVLVLEAFIGPKPSGKQGCHFPDRDPANNRVDNLMWGTPKENSSHAMIHGTTAKGKHLNQGELHGNAKITEEDVLEIRRLRSTGMAYKEIAKRYPINWESVRNAAIGLKWKHI